MLPLIDEWKPSSPAMTPFFFAVLAIDAVLIAWKRPRLPWVRWLLLGGAARARPAAGSPPGDAGDLAAMMLPQALRKRSSAPQADRTLAGRCSPARRCWS